MKKLKYKYAFFDADGTLFDSEPGIIDCIEQTLIANKVKYRKEDLHKMIGPPFRVSMREFCGLSYDETEQFVNDYRDRYDDFGWKNSSVYDGVKELLQSLKDGGVHLAVATSKPIFFAEKMLKYYGIFDYFEFVGAAVSDVSRDTKQAVVQWTIDNMKIDDVNDVIMIGDRKYDVEGAKACNIETIGVAWGYGTRQELTESGAKIVLDTPKEVEQYLLG